LLIYWAQTLLDISEKGGLEVNAEKTKGMFMSHHQIAGRNHNV